MSTWGFPGEAFGPEWRRPDEERGRERRRFSRQDSRMLRLSIMGVIAMALLQKAGVASIGLMTEPPDDN